MKSTEIRQRSGKTGKQGEEIAGRFLQTRGYEILALNWRCKEGEIDVVARQGETLVFVEVRTRRQGTDAAFESISPRKQKRMIAAAHQYLNANQLDDTLWRIDAIAVSFERGAPLIEHVENALDW